MSREHEDEEELESTKEKHETMREDKGNAKSVSDALRIRVIKFV